MATEGEEDRYQCPVCGLDMTEQVISRCKSAPATPMIIDVDRPASSSTHGREVGLQCANGHWAEYHCPS